MSEFYIERNDVLKSIYFILSMAQNQKSHAMHGSLSSKGDLIGGIFDRWINIIPESVVFNKILLPSIANDVNVEIISDFYRYDPKIAGIAPDLIGLKINNKIVPFVTFDKKWVPVKECPQIEIKTFKKAQKMISLRNQGYDDKYLIMIESDFRIDYLLPFFSEDVVSDDVYKQLKMEDSIFIVNNDNCVLDYFSKLDTSDSRLGKIKLLKITQSKDFMNISTHCESYVSVQYINEITATPKSKRNYSKEEPLKNFCTQNALSLYTFNENWYDGIKEGIPFVKQKNRELFLRTIDFYTNDIDAITITKKSKSSMYIESSRECQFNDVKLLPNLRYKISFSTLERNDNPKDEYFMQKSLVKHIFCRKEELESSFKRIIDKNK